MRELPTGRVDVLDMLSAREMRVARQRAMLNSGGTPVCLSMNIPGDTKVSTLIYAAFKEGERLILSTLKGAREVTRVVEKTGLEAYFIVPKSPEDVKTALCDVEDNAPLGRLYDIDVFDKDGEKISREGLGRDMRTCFLCGQPAFLCARSRAHTVGQMREKIDADIRAFIHDDVAARLAKSAREALVLEALTTPKPGLVDKNNCGAHKDMTLKMFLLSARALEGYFLACARTGFSKDTDVFPALQTLGVCAEADMLSATGGVNTHKGAIFSLGVLCAAAAKCAYEGRLYPRDVLSTAGEMASPYAARHFALLTKETARTFGDKLYVKTGERGIRGEAAAGFPALAGVWDAFVLEAGTLGREAAGVRALIRLLTTLNDTTLLKRGGQEAQAFVRARAKKIADAGFPTGEILALDEEMIQKGLTCGGCADLLACLYFMDALQL